jgi:hypothetical protein
MRITSFTSMEQRSELLQTKTENPSEELSSEIKMELNHSKESAGPRLQFGLIFSMKTLLNIGHLSIVMISS